MTGALRAWILALCLVAAGAGDGFAQTTPATGAGQAAPSPLTIARQKAAAAGLDYGAWTRLADRAEAQVANPLASAGIMEQTRAQIADWRAAFLAAQGRNATRIDTLRKQIDALGPEPAEGATEPDEIAGRRKELTQQLARLQAPVIAAVEAYSRADGLIREIDRVLRERQAAELLKLWPMPVNPANWPVAAETLGTSLAAVGGEVASNWTNPRLRAELTARLPLILALLAVALAAIWRGRRWFEALPNRLQARSTGRGREVWAFLASLGQIVVPSLGVYALARAIEATSMIGPAGERVVSALPLAGFSLFLARWLALRVFPKNEAGPGSLRLTAEERAEGRVHGVLLGLMLMVELVRQALIDPVRVPEAATSVTAFPIFVLLSLSLYRIGRLLRRHMAAATPADEGAAFRDRLIGLLGAGAIGISVAGPVLAAVGYVAAGTGLVIPAVLSMALIAGLSILQTLVGHVYAAVTRRSGTEDEALFPVLAGFLIVLSALPVFALIWGAREADIAELFTRLGEGFTIGETRISPGSFGVFALVFGLGFLVTRLVQGALRTSVLPKTKLDRGGQNAVTAGTGYLGMFLAGLIAINAAGIDLSGLAIVAGALSLGIGFGLQNIVQNFVSGIILLIERPVSEGDWIETGGTQGIVKSISVRSTRIQTFDRTDVIVPNADLVSGRVTNWTRFNLTGRVVVPVGVAYGSDTRKVERVLREIAEAQPLAILNPPPLVTFAGFGADALNFEVRVILRDVNFSLAVRNEINHQIAERFAAEGIEMPFAQRDLWLRNAGEVARAFRGLPPGEPPAAPQASDPATAPQPTGKEMPS